jgi:hypothetical protein
MRVFKKRTPSLFLDKYATKDEYNTYLRDLSKI